MFDPEYSRYDEVEPEPDPRAKSLWQWIREPGVAKEVAGNIISITQESISDLWSELQGSRRLTRSALFLVLAGSAAGTSTCRVDEISAKPTQPKAESAPAQSSLPAHTYAASDTQAQELRMSLQETQCKTVTD